MFHRKAERERERKRERKRERGLVKSGNILIQEMCKDVLPHSLLQAESGEREEREKAEITHRLCKEEATH